MNSSNRPLSPHLQIYRPQLHTTLSILHRLAGIALALGAAFFALWLSTGAYSPSYFSYILDLLTSFPGKLFLLGWAFLLFYHLCNGIRHLIWDLNIGLENQQVRSSGYVTVACTIGLTVIVSLAGYFACS